ncbi:MAG TPA: GntR family transcriptional regulator [Gaiellaceae bacterium]
MSSSQLRSLATSTVDLKTGVLDAEPTRADQAYVRLREEIIATHLPPGTLLREDELMRRLGVGRTPVREALLRLQSDGFITIIPRRGTLVSEVNITDLAAIYEVRARLESWAARLAAERARDEDRREAEELMRELDAMTDDQRYEALLALDRRIHRFVYRTSKNDFLFETLDHYHNLSLRILQVAMRRYPALTPRLEDVVQEQRTLLDAICRGDGERAEQVAVDHVLTFEAELRKLI